MSDSNLQVIEAVTQFVGGTQAVWNTITIPVPAGMVVYATDTTAVKMGDGTTLYANLPTLFTISSIVSLTNLVSSLGTNTGANAAAIATLTTEYNTLLSALNALTTVVNTIAPTTRISESGNITITNTQYFVGIANMVPAATEVLLPPEPVANEAHVIKDVHGVAPAYNITINGNGNLIDGQATSVIRTKFQTAFVYWNGTSWSLVVVDRQIVNLFPISGNPNGSLAGAAAGATDGATGVGSAPDMAWDGSTLWVCTTSGTATTAVWSSMTGTHILNPVQDLGSISTGVVVVDRSLGMCTKITAGGPFSITAVQGFIPGYSETILELVNGGSTTISWPGSVNWVTSTGAVTTSFSSYGVQLQDAGTDFFAFWSPDGGTTIYGKVVR